MLNRAVYVGKDAILDAYDSQNNDGLYTYSVWYNPKDIAFQYPWKDSEKGRKLLEDNLEAMEQAGNKDLLYLKFHPAEIKGIIDRKTPTISCTPVRVCELTDEERMTGTQPNYVPMQSGMNGQAWKILHNLESLPQQINTKLDSFDVRLKAIEDSELLDEPEEAQGIDKYVAIVNGVAQNPQLMGLVTEVLGLLKGVLKPVQQPVMYTTVNGVNSEPPLQGNSQSVINDDLLNDSLRRLHPYCKLDTDLALLADLAETNKPMFDMVLNNLRNK